MSKRKIADRIAEAPPTRCDMIPPKLLSTQAAAKYLGISPASLNKARSEGTRGGRTPMPPFVRVGGLVYYRLCDLDEWLAGLVTRMAV